MGGRNRGSDWARVGELLRRYRGAMTVAEAAHRARVSRGWWDNAEAGFVRHRPKPSKLAAAVDAVGADLGQVFRAAGYDPAPFLDRAGTGRSTRAAATDEELTLLRETVERQGRRLHELAELTADVHRQGSELTDLLVRLARRPDDADPADPPAVSSR